MNNAAPTGLLFDAVLTPHRSLSPAGFRALMAATAATCLAVGWGFWLAGAWPVAGFLGLEILLLWGAFRLSYRAGGLRETLQLSSEALTVRRIFPSGRAREWRFQPYWLTVEVEGGDARDGRLMLASHGRRVAIGAFLAPDERIEVAEALRAALRRLHCIPAPLPRV